MELVGRGLECAVIQRYAPRMIDPQIIRSAIEHHQAGRHAEAEAGYREYLAHDPTNAGVWNNFAVLALDRREWQAVCERSDRAIALAPNRPELYCTRAFALNGLGRTEEAIRICNAVLQVQRDCAPAWFALGEAHAADGHNEDAVAAYRAALQCKPAYAAAANNLGNLLTNLNDFDGAITVFRTALGLAPHGAATHNNLGAALREIGRHEEAIACFRRALELAPHLAKARSSLILALLYTPGTTRAMLAEETQRWWREHGTPLWRGDRPFPNDRDPDRPLRIGYVSADFRDHPVGRHLLPLLREHDRAQFTITAYSGARGTDRTTARFRELGIVWRDVARLDDAALAAQIEADHIDLLVDLSLHSADDRLLVFARQPAPVQISFAGYPGETGLESIAYHLTDSVLEPHGALRLRNSFWCMDPPDDAPEVNPLPALSGSPFVFGCLHKFAKVNPQTIEWWSRILRAVPSARLVMLCPQGETRAPLLAAFHAHGIGEGRVELVSFLPRPDYLAMHHRIDVILDTFPYNGHMTALDALWMGVPFVTLAGDLPASRGGASILTQVGLTELIARTPEDYIRIATELAADLPRLASLRTSLRERMKASPLMDASRFARGVEEAWRAAWWQWCGSPTNQTSVIGGRRLLRIAFADFCGWDFHAQSVDVLPMGGSQSAACHLARGMAREGHEIFLISSTSSPGRYDGVTCLSWAHTDAAALRALKLDVFVCILAAGNGVPLRQMLGPGTLLILWNQHAHDQAGVQALNDPREREAYDAFAMVSDWQKGQFHRCFGIDPRRMTVMRNAIAPAFTDLFSKGESVLGQKTMPPVIAYTSTPFRGLDVLLDAFGSIRMEIPDVRLRVYSSMKVYQTSATEDEAAYGALYRRCREMEGVEYIGSLPQPELAHELRKVAVLAYPNTFAETSCIGVMEAMAAGCCVVTSQLGALPETGAGFARLIPVEQGRKAYLDQFIAQTIQILRAIAAGSDDIESELHRQVDQMNRTAIWQVRAREWSQWLETLAVQQ